MPASDPVRRNKREQFEAAQSKKQEQEQRNAARLGPHYALTTAKGRVPMGRTVRVACPLYDGLFAIFRTDVKQRILEARYRLEVVQNVERRKDETDEQFAQRQLEAVSTPTVENACKRLRARVVGFEGWDFVQVVVDEQGEPVLDGEGEYQYEPIPQPDPLDWRTYTPLVITNSDLIDVGRWCFLEGYEEALEIAGGNS
jgi:hypothetical protein